jgi:hypothetical protein
MFLNCSTCFGRQTAHHQELKNCNCSLWFYTCLWLPAAEMAEPSQRSATKNIRKTRGCNYSFWAPDNGRFVARNIRITNSTTRSHFVGSFYEIYIRKDSNIREKINMTYTKAIWNIATVNCVSQLTVVCCKSHIKENSEGSEHSLLNTKSKQHGAYICMYYNMYTFVGSYFSKHTEAWCW